MSKTKERHLLEMWADGILLECKVDPNIIFKIPKKKRKKLFTVLGESLGISQHSLERYYEC